MERYYTDKGFISKGASLNILDPQDSKYFLLIPTTDMPETKGAPSTQDKTVLTDNAITQTEGLQTVDQKVYTFNYHRDNINILKKYAGKALSFLERNPDNTGEKYTGSFQFGRSALSVDGIVQGQIYVTVSSSDDFPVEDVRDIMKPTAIITSPLPDVQVSGTNSVDIAITTSEGAVVTATSESTSIANANYETGKLTITGVAKGYTKVILTCSKTGEATSTRSILVEVTD